MYGRNSHMRHMFLEDHKSWATWSSRWIAKLALQCIPTQDDSGPVWRGPGPSLLQCEVHRGEISCANFVADILTYYLLLEPYCFDCSHVFFPYLQENT